jgi:eukaryotic-like serine/threonine-protein kinase
MGTPPRKLISDLYHAAVARPPEERNAFLKEACEGDPALREEVESLLHYESAAAHFLDRPAATMVANGRLPAPDMVGRQLGPYQIVALIGAGGMGEVYRARDTRLDRLVAIKVLAPSAGDHARRLDRLDREARAISRVSHPHICALFDVGREDHVTFLVMEYLEGETLSTLIEERALTLRQTVEIAIQIADALDAAHCRGVVHRDLKPSNVMLTSDGVKLLDFGLERNETRRDELQSRDRQRPRGNRSN